MTRLIITNGQSGVDSIQRAGIEGKLVSWDDVLHDGPVPAGHTLSTLSEVRAQFLSSKWGDYATVLEKFKQRDSMLEKADDFDEIILFFEHDLYDQLQLIQLLSYFEDGGPQSFNLTIAFPPTFIAYCDPVSLRHGFAARQSVSNTFLNEGAAYWRAFTADDPIELGALLRKRSASLPHLDQAMVRMAEEYPDSKTGLSRTELQILAVLETAPCTAGKLFGNVRQMEEAQFMGDTSFWWYLDGIAGGETPLIAPQTSYRIPPVVKDFSELIASTFEIAPAGKRALHGEQHRAELIPIDRWIGGVHVTNENLWSWHAAEKTIRR